MMPIMALLVICAAGETDKVHSDPHGFRSMHEQPDGSNLFKMISKFQDRLNQNMKSVQHGYKTYQMPTNGHGTYFFRFDTRI